MTMGQVMRAVAIFGAILIGVFAVLGDLGKFAVLWLGLDVALGFLGTFVP